MERRAPRIAFLRMGPHPIPNRLLPDALVSVSGSVEVYDVEAAVRRDPLAWLVNPVFVLFEHGRSLLRGSVRPWKAFFTTTWMFRRMSRLARRFVERGDFDLTLQIQSLFDARSPGLPHFVYTDHTHLANLGYPEFDPRTLRGGRWIALERALYEGAATVFTRSRHVSASLCTQYGLAPERVECVGAGSNARVPDGEPRGRDPRAPRILFVGVDWERKGGPDLLAAFARLHGDHPEARLVIVGCEPTIDAPGVEVHGRCPVEEVHRHFEAASIFCLPVYREPFGVVFVEAMHYALPVVATRVGAIPDLVESGENGWLVEVGDVAGLTASLDRLLREPESREKMGARSRDRARADYTWPRVAERIANTMREMVE
jgi:glycosyltransferase involved in cell wall biosynthesis